MAEGQKTPLFYHLAFEVMSLQFTAVIDWNNLAASVEDWLRLASLTAQSVKNLTAMQETQVQFLGREDPPRKELATHSSILA